jgi:hypothetical protein
LARATRVTERIHITRRKRPGMSRYAESYTPRSGG